MKNSPDWLIEALSREKKELLNMKTGNKNYLVWEAETKKEWRKWIEFKDLWGTINHIKIHKVSDSSRRKNRERIFQEIIIQ